MTTQFYCSNYRQLASNGIAQDQFLTDLDDGSESEVQSNIIRNIIIFLIDIIAPGIGVRGGIASLSGECSLSYPFPCFRYRLPGTKKGRLSSWSIISCP